MLNNNIISKNNILQIIIQWKVIYEPSSGNSISPGLIIRGNISSIIFWPEFLSTKCNL